MLRLSIKAINDTMGPEVLVPSFLVFGVIPSLPVINKPLPNQGERMAALSLVRAKMATITEELKTAQALRSELSPATHFSFSAGDEVRVYKEREMHWCVLVKVIRT